MITYNGFFLVRKPFFAGKKPQKPFFPQQKRTYLKRSIKFSPIFNGDYNSLCPFIPPKRNHAEIRSPKVEILAPDRSQDLIPVVVGGLTHQISPAHLTQISEKNKIKGERWSWFSDVIGAPRICQPSSFWRVLIGTMCSLPSPEKKQKRDWLVGTCFYQMMVQFQILSIPTWSVCTKLSIWVNQPSNHLGLFGWKMFSKKPHLTCRIPAFCE